MIWVESALAEAEREGRFALGVALGACRADRVVWGLEGLTAFRWDLLAKVIYCFLGLSYVKS